MAQKDSTYNLIADNDIIPWLDDNETKYKWNGALTNFSNLDPEDYASTIFNVTGVVVTASTGTTLYENPIVVTVVEGDTNYVVTASAASTLASDVTVNTKVGGKALSVVIPKLGVTAMTTTDVPVTSETPTIESAKTSPSQDDYYVYTPKIKSTKVEEFVCYYGTLLDKKSGNITMEDISAMETRLINVDGVVLNYVIPQRTVEEPSEEQLKDCTYCLIFCVPKNIYTNNRYKIVDTVFGQSSGFLKLYEMDINGESFMVLYNGSEGTEFVGRYGYDITYSYTASYKAE